MKELVQQMKHTLHLGTEAAMSANDGDGDLSFSWNYFVLPDCNLQKFLMRHNMETITRAQIPVATSGCL